MVASRVPRLADLPATARTDIAAFTPPPRFGSVDLESFEAHHPSQGRAKERVREFALARSDRSSRSARRRGWLSRLTRRVESPVTGDGLYLDGGFGVGKTHLLAAAFFLAPTLSKRYVSFQQLVHLIGVLGMREAQERVGGVRLLCLDEFELDDPGNTLMVKTFLAHVFARGGSVITTSNTAPEALRLGRFNAEDFRREIQSIAESFEVLRVDGPDARRASAEARLMRVEELPPPSRRAIRTDWRSLFEHLRAHHPASYRAQLEGLDALVVEGARPLPEQGDALRLVHFIDNLYDLRVALWLAAAERRGDGAPWSPARAFDLFEPEYRNGAYETKYRRCASRLSEVLGEARALASRAAGEPLRSARGPVPHPNQA